MPRPESITNEDLVRWSESIDNDPLLDKQLAQNPIIREVCYAGQYLAEKLRELDCSEEIIGRVMYTAGQLSFGQEDAWMVHQEILQKFIAGTLEFEKDSDLN